MARSIGRPMAVLVLSDEEQSYLERQVRRRRVARSISDRCRMILHCADGLTNKAGQPNSACTSTRSASGAAAS